MIHTDGAKCVAITNNNLQVLAGAHCAKDQLKARNTGTGTCLPVCIHTFTPMLSCTCCSPQVTSSWSWGLVMAPVWEQATGSLLTSFDLQSQIKHITLDEIVHLLCIYKPSKCHIYKFHRSKETNLLYSHSVSPWLLLTNLEVSFNQRYCGFWENSTHWDHQIHIKWLFQWLQS